MCSFAQCAPHGCSGRSAEAIPSLNRTSIASVKRLKSAVAKVNRAPSPVADRAPGTTPTSSVRGGIKRLATQYDLLPGSLNGALQPLRLQLCRRVAIDFAAEAQFFKLGLRPFHADLLLLDSFLLRRFPKISGRHPRR